MEPIHSATWVNRTDVGLVQLIDRQHDGDARQRSTRAYQSTARADRGPAVSRRLNAPVSLELSGAPHVQAYANFADAPANDRVHVLLVDAATTRTLGELTVDTPDHGHRQMDDYRRLGLLRGLGQPRS